MKVIAKNLLPDDDRAVERVLAAMHDAWPYATDQDGIKRAIQVVPHPILAERVVEALRKNP